MRRKSMIGSHIVSFMCLMCVAAGVNAATIRTLEPASNASISFADNLAVTQALLNELHIHPADARSLSWLDAAQFNPFASKPLATPSFDELAARARHRAAVVGYRVGGSPHLVSAGGDLWLMMLVGLGLIAYQLRRKQRYLQPTPFAS